MIEVFHMGQKQAGEPTYTAGQAARMLGCSLRTLYRWEEDGTIPAVDRVNRGKLRVRIFTESQIERIRRKVQGRLSFTQSLHDGYGMALSPLPPLDPVLQALAEAMRSAGLNLPVPSEYQRLFADAMKFVEEHGCASVTVTLPDGRTQTFALSRKQKSVR
jgi:excisionase family DNA binding protein